MNAACEAHRSASASGGGLAKWRRERRAFQAKGAFVGVEVPTCMPLLRNAEKFVAGARDVCGEAGRWGLRKQAL